MKKRIALLVALIGTVLIAGCSSSSSTTETTTASEPEATEAAATEPEATEPEAAEPAAAEPAAGSKGVIYIITASYATPMFETEARIATETAEKLGYEVKAVSHDDDLTVQAEIIDTAISDGAVGILLDNAGAEGSVEAVKKAKEAGIPTVCIDRELASEGVAITQFVSNNYQGASGVAEVFVEAMGEEGKYAELLGKETETACTVRSQGFHDVIDQYEDLEMVAQETANWEQTTAYEKMETILQAHPDITGVICGNDPMALGAAAACKAAGLEGVAIISVDGSDEARDAILAGDMTATAMQQAAYQAQLGIETIDNYISTGNSGFDEEKQLIDCLTITIDNAENLSQFVYTE